MEGKEKGRSPFRQMVAEVLWYRSSIAGKRFRPEYFITACFQSMGYCLTAKQACFLFCFFLFLRLRREKACDEHLFLYMRMFHDGAYGFLVVGIDYDDRFFSGLETFDIEMIILF